MVNSTKSLLELKIEMSSFLSLHVAPNLEGCDGRQLWQVILLFRQEWPIANQIYNFLAVGIYILVTSSIRSLNELETFSSTSICLTCA